MQTHESRSPVEVGRGHDEMIWGMKVVAMTISHKHMPVAGVGP